MRQLPDAVDRPSAGCSGHDPSRRGILGRRTSELRRRARRVAWAHGLRPRPRFGPHFVERSSTDRWPRSPAAHLVLRPRPERAAKPPRSARPATAPKPRPTVCPWSD